MITKREQEILQLIVKEFSCKEMAEELNISIHTVESHRKNLYKKTKAKTLIGLVNYAYKHKLI
jgi:DNA-binding CsgD family transcriptional regulator